jgi:hypothetical protein
MSGPDIAALEQLVVMRERGLITEAEYAAKRAAILARVGAPAAQATPALAKKVRPPMSTRAKVGWGFVGLLLLSAVANGLTKPSPTQPVATTSPTRPAFTSPPAASGLGTRSAIVAYLESLGFTGSESPLADGRSRWLGRRTSDSATAEVIGPANAIDNVSLTVATDAEGAESAGTLVGGWLDRYAPVGGRDFFASAFDKYDGSADLDESRDLGDRLLHIQTLTATDGVIVIVTIDHD